MPTQPSSPCPTCASVDPHRYKFCPACGREVARPPAAPTPPADYRAWLMATMKITEQDLVENARGVLGPSQGAIVRKSGVRGVVINGLVALGLAVASVGMLLISDAVQPPIELSANLLKALVMPVVFLAGAALFCVYLLRSLRDLTGSPLVHAVEGPVTFETRMPMGTGGGTTSYYLHVAGEEFEVKHLHDNLVLSGLARGHPHRVYYTVQGRTVVALVPLAE